MTESKNCIDLIKQYENAALYIHKSISSPNYDKMGQRWQIGYGTTRYPDQSYVTSADKPITEEQATIYLKWYVDICAACINKVITSALNQNQFDACVILSYNIGVTSFANSTLAKTINNNPNDLENIKTQWMRWKYLKGIPNPGLLARREKEYQLYISGILI